MSTPEKHRRVKTRKRNRVKPPAPRRNWKDPLAHLPLIAYMNAHFESILMRGYTQGTVKARRLVIRRFIAWCDERGLKQPADITKQVMERWQRHLFYYRKPDGKPMTIGTQTANLAPLKLWFKWMARENHILYNPASEIDLPRKARQLPRVILSVQEVEAILAEACDNNPMGLRDRALLELLYSTGIRRMEAAGLAVYDLDLNRRLLMVREGKGRRDRVVPVGHRAAAWLDKYLLESRPKLLTFDHPALFITDYGEAMTPGQIAIRVRHYMEHAGIDKPGATHLLRHACATHMLEGGADVRFLQVLLGHERLDTTAIYTHVAIEKLQAVHDATHPARLQRAGADHSATSEDRATLLAALEADSDA